MVKFLTKWLTLLASIALLPLLQGSAIAAQGDKAGWQLSTDPRGRVFLSYFAVDDGPSNLTFACLKDTSTFGFFADDLKELAGPLAHATLELSGGPAKFTVPGIIEPDPDSGLLGFVGELPVNAGTAPKLAASLGPLLQSTGPIVLRFGKQTRELPPVTGLVNPARRFFGLCFGQ